MKLPHTKISSEEFWKFQQISIDIEGASKYNHILDKSWFSAASLSSNLGQMGTLWQMPLVQEGRSKDSAVAHPFLHPVKQFCFRKIVKIYFYWVKTKSYPL